MLPNSINEAWIAAFVRGLAQDQDEYGVYLIGGDTNSTPGPLSIAITAFGEVSTDRLLRRSGARVGDTIFVTGTIGDSALGLRVLDGALPTLDPRSAAFLANRYRLPLPRVTVGPRLIGLATAAIDVSDGLIADLRHICEVSGLAGAVEAPRVPLSAAGRAATSTSPECLAAALTGGDDYEILFTAPPESETTLAELSRMVGISITPIGRMVTPSAGNKSLVSVLDAIGRPLPLSREGWTHF
jgi:thiamine-monophosphate kinase